MVLRGIVFKIIHKEAQAEAGLEPPGRRVGRPKIMRRKSVISETKAVLW